MKKGCFIKPCYKDYISITCGFDYDEFEDKNRVCELDLIINTIFTNPELKEYYLETYQLVYADNKLKIFLLLQVQAVMVKVY